MDTKQQLKEALIALGEVINNNRELAHVIARYYFLKEKDKFQFEAATEKLWHKFDQDYDLVNFVFANTKYDECDNGFFFRRS